jgi:hypothetical protein
MHHPATSTTHRMADVMREHYANTGHCSENDLHNAGFSKADIDKHRPDAVKLAYAASNREVRK